MAAVAAGTAGAAVIGGVVAAVSKVGDWLKDVGRQVWSLFKKLGEWFMAGVKWLGARIRDAMAGAKDAVKHLVNFIARVLKAAWDWLKGVVPRIFAELMKLIRWYMRMLAEKPEVGLTATLLFLYLLS
jgi:ABC-type proline/glycine betaine transport system permease subunit